MFHQHVIPSAHNAYRPHFLRPSWLGFFLAVILAAEGFLVTNLIVRQSNESFLAAVVPGEVVALTNAQRTTQHINTLQESSVLDIAAQAKANDMAAKSYFSHVSPDGKTPWDWITQAGYSYQYAGENLAMNFVDAQDIVHAWMASPTHRSNLLNTAYTSIGIGVANGIYEGKPVTFVVQFFASPLSQEAAVVNTHMNPPWRLLSRLQSEPLYITEWVLGSIALLLLAVLCVAAIRHIEIQSSYMFVTAGAVCAIAFVLWISNSTILESTVWSAQPAAALVGAGQIEENSVSIPISATSTVRG